MADSLVLGKAGGGEDFISFMEKELIPYVDSAYSTQPYRVLIGHSLAGLPVVNSLINHTALFNGYIAIDPSIWWDHEKLLNESADALAKNQYVNTGFFLGIANSMEGANDTTLVKRDTSRLSGQIRSNLKFAKVISGNKQNKLKSKWVYYSQEDHESVPLIATYDALHFIFDFYKLKLTQQDLADTTDALATKIELHYQKVSEQMGYSIYPPEDLVSKLGYKAIEEKQWTRAVSCLK
ncbi:MAG: alpha/beta hydrolase [Chitinophagaceae bacterium]|nr:alpha/beta hydrolase [Chitinophagaceae bacterium]